jgi:hypothetical protein
LDRLTKDVTDLIVHYSRWPSLLRAVRREAPWVRLHVRAHNAEAFQFWQRCDLRLRPTYRNLRNAYGAWRILRNDVRCRLRADKILGISEWDNRHYWAWLPGRSTISWLPYTSPWPVLRPQVKPLLWSERELAIACMPGAQDRIGNSVLAGFRQLAEVLNGDHATAPWRFLVTAGSLGKRDSQGQERLLTFLDTPCEPWDVLCSCRAVAVLSPLGFGMKTTIIDGLTAGCHAVVHPVVAQRLPEDVRNECIIWDPRDTGSVRLLCSRLCEPPRSRSVNERLRMQAITTLTTALSARGA